MNIRHDKWRTERNDLADNARGLRIHLSSARLYDSKQHLRHLLDVVQVVSEIPWQLLRRTESDGVRLSSRISSRICVKIVILSHCRAEKRLV